MLRPTESPLYGGAVGVEPSPPRCLSRDQRVEPVGLDPSAGGLALAGRAAPLGGLALVVGTGEAPVAVFAGRRLVVATLDCPGLAQLHDGVAVPCLEGVVDRANVVAGVHRARLRAEPP